MALQFLKTSVEDGIGIVSLNRPPVNALSAAVFLELAQVFQEWSKDPKVRVIILTGEGAVFAAGADLNEIATVTKAGDGESMALKAQEMGRLIANSPVPVICAVNGPCMGGGSELAMCCHIRIASDRARFAQPEVKVGIVPGLGGTQRLPRLVGTGQALEILLTGEPISAAQAKAIGLVNAVVPEAELRRTAVNLARRIAANSKAIVALILKAVREGTQRPIDDAMRLEASLFGASMETADKKEGVAAFLEKRAPKFADR